MKEIAIKISLVTLILNIILSIGKAFAGIVGHSSAMLSDAVHSASDCVSTLVVMFGISLASKEPDEDHQYGHEKIESVASIVLSVILAITGFTIGIEGIGKIINNTYSVVIPTALGLYAAVISIIIKEWMFWYTRSGAIKIKSDALMADAWHHRSDALTSIGSFIGIFGARLGYPILDPLTSVMICLFILKAAYDIFNEAKDKIVDKVVDDNTILKIKELILSSEGVIKIDDLKTRLFGNIMFVDVEISVDANLLLIDAHQIAENVHDSIETEFKDVRHCTVHVNPFER